MGLSSARRSAGASAKPAPAMSIELAPSRSGGFRSEGHVRPPGSGTGVLSKPEAVAESPCATVLLLRSFETVLDLSAYVVSLVK
jgi:hypothetical protein